MPIPSQGYQDARWNQRQQIYEQTQRPATSWGFTRILEQAPVVRPPSGHFSRLQSSVLSTPSAPSTRPVSAKPAAGVLSRPGSGMARTQSGELQEKDLVRLESQQKRLRFDENRLVLGPTRPLRPFIGNNETTLMRGSAMKVPESERPPPVIVEEEVHEQAHQLDSPMRSSLAALSPSSVRSPTNTPGKRKKVSRADARRYNLALDQMQMEGLMNSLEGVNAAAPDAKAFSRREAEDRANPNSLVDTIKQTLRSLIFTSMLSDRHIAIIASECSLRHYDAGEIIVREGEDCVSLFVLLEGEVGEYRDLENFGHLTVADPIRLVSYRSTTLSQHMDVFCAMSVFTGAPAHSMYAAIKNATIIIRLPTVAFQPILVNQPSVVNKIAELLLGFLLQSSFDNATRVSLANRILNYHQQFSRDKPGISWKLSPRSRAHHPRAWHKEPDKMGMLLCDPDEAAPCVGTKEGQLKPPSHVRLDKMKIPVPDVPGGTHLSPRLYQRDSSKGGCSYGLSRRNFEEVVKSNKASSVQNSFRDDKHQESWAVQETLIEQPLVKAPGVTPCGQGFHHYFASRGSTAETLEELNPSVENPALNRTRLARDVLMAKEKAIRIEHSRPSYACELRQEPHDSEMMMQLRTGTHGEKLYAPLSRYPLEYASSPSRAELTPEQPPLISYECAVRHKYSHANMPGVFDHPQYMCSRTDQPAHHGELARQHAIELNDSRLVERYPSAFPAQATYSMLKTSPYLIKSEQRARTPDVMRRSLSRKSLSGSLDDHVQGSPTGSTAPRSPYGKKSPEVTKEDERWVSMLRTADTTGLLPPDADDKHHVTYVCEMRKQTPFHLTKTRKQAVKASHRFSSLLAHEAEAPLPASTAQEALERSSRPTTEDIFRDTPPGAINWAQELSNQWHDNDMFAVIAHPARSSAPSKVN